MTQEKQALAPSDAELVAYLDGELSPSDSVRIGQQIAVDRTLAERVGLLMKGARPFRQGFAPLLAEAPMDKLEALLAGSPDRAGPVPQRVRLPSRFWPAAVAAGLAFMIFGAGIDRFALPPIAGALRSAASDTEAADDWRRAVAQYLSLYTSETLSIIPDAGDGRQRELASVGGKLGLDLTPARVALPDMALKRAEMLDYEDSALGFLAYLDPHGGPVSLCIIAGAGADAPPRVERRHGMNVVYWSQAGHGFMLIGRAGVDHLRTLAALVADRFGGSAGGRSGDAPG